LVKLSKHPYDKFGLKPKRVNLSRVYLYHAVCPKNYKRELNGIEPPVFVATQPKLAIEIVKMVHNCKNPIVLKINVKGLPIYKDLYWENDDKQYKDDYSKFPEPVAMFMMRDMELPLRKITENKIFYIPRKVVKERIYSRNKKKITNQKQLTIEQLKGMNKKQLYDYCRSNNIKGYSNMNKTYINNLILQSYKSGNIIVRKKSILIFTKTYHGTTYNNVNNILSRGLDVKRSRGKSVGIYNSISVTDNILLAKSMIKGETGLDKEGKILVINKRLKIIDLRNIEGKKYWESLNENPIKAIKENVNGVAFKNYESIRIKSFYKDIPLSKVKNALEIQVFKSIEPKYIKVVKSGKKPTKKAKETTEFKYNKFYSDLRLSYMLSGGKFEENTGAIPIRRVKKMYDKMVKKTPDKEWVDELFRVYHKNFDTISLIVGRPGEGEYKGFNYLGRIYTTIIIRNKKR